MQNFLMPAKNGTHELIIERSRFICHVFRVNSLEEANAYIAEVRDTHAKANHNCVAYLIGENNDFGRAADDGEPSGTAGAPMLEVLKRQDIRNCLVVVTRYFGGIKLGAGGLIRAYGTAVSEGLKAVGLVNRIKLQSVFLTCDYSIFDSLMSKINGKNYTVGQTEYSERVKLEVFVEIENVEEFNNWIISFSNDTIVIKVGKISFREIPI